MEDIKVIDTKYIVKRELLGFMVDNKIIKPNDLFKWDELNIKYKAYCVTQAMKMLGVI